MNELVDIKIKCIDPKRRPCLVNKNYIDVIFELSDKADKDWCVIFNDNFSNSGTNIRINPEEGQYVETWVRDMEDIPETLNLIKEKTDQTNIKYSDKLIADDEKRKDSYNQVKSVASERLEAILGELDFD